MLLQQHKRKHQGVLWLIVSTLLLICPFYTYGQTPPKKSTTPSKNQTLIIHKEVKSESQSKKTSKDSSKLKLKKPKVKKAAPKVPKRQRPGSTIIHKRDIEEKKN